MSSFADFMANHAEYNLNSCEGFMKVLTVKGEHVEWVRVEDKFEFHAEVAGHKLTVYGDIYRYQGLPYPVRGTDITLEEPSVSFGDSDPLQVPPAVAMTKRQNMIAGHVRQTPTVYAVETICDHCGAPMGTVLCDEEVARTRYGNCRQYGELQEHNDWEVSEAVRNADLYLLRFSSCGGCRTAY